MAAAENAVASLEGAGVFGVVGGLYKLKSSLTHSLKPPGSNP
jgi:hypothetical protein